MVSNASVLLNISALSGAPMLPNTLELSNAPQFCKKMLVGIKYIRLIPKMSVSRFCLRLLHDLLSRI